MTNQPPWKISVTNGLRAHFKQPTGPSRPGTQWSLTLTNGTESYPITVRVFAQNDTQIPDDQQTRKAADYIFELLNRGWSPAQYNGEPMEITILPQQRA